MNNEELRQAIRNASNPKWKVKDNTVTVILSSGRSQAVVFRLSPDSIVLESTVASNHSYDTPLDAATFLTEQHEGLIAIQLRIIDDCIMARKELPLEVLHDTDLGTAIIDLAIEADRIEWLLTGKDEV